MSTLASVIDDLRPYVVTVLAAPRGLTVEVGSVAVHDSTDSPEIGSGDVVFAVGLRPAGAVPLVEQAAAAAAAAVVLKAKPPVDPAVIEAANEHGVALLAVPLGASWAQLVTLVRAALARLPSDTSPITLADVEAGDLFGMANAIAALVDAPVTIEDLQSRVIAYSARQQEADEPRIETILGRRVPERILRRLYKEGVFDRLARSSEPLYFQPGEASDMAREAVAIRAGGEVVGWIWAAVSGPLTAEKRRALVDAANLVAVQVTRSRLDADVTRRIRADLTTSLLEGRADAVDAAAQLGLGGGRFRVMAVASLHSEEVDADFARLRVWDLLAFHLAPTSKSFATTLSPAMAYAVVRSSSSDELDRERLLQAAATMTERAHSTLHVELVVGLGGAVAGIAGIPRSRAEAEQTVRVLKRRSRAASAAEVEEVRTEILLEQVLEVLRREAAVRNGRLRSVEEHDAKHGSDYVATLRAYFDTFGDTLAAAARLHVHPNTFRYRLQRMREVAGVQLDDPAERLLLMLQLKLSDSSGQLDMES